MDTTADISTGGGVVTRASIAPEPRPGSCRDRPIVAQARWGRGGRDGGKKRARSVAASQVAPAQDGPSRRGYNSRFPFAAHRPFVAHPLSPTVLRVRGWPWFDLSLNHKSFGMAGGTLHFVLHVQHSGLPDPGGWPVTVDIGFLETLLDHVRPEHPSQRP